MNAPTDRDPLRIPVYRGDAYKQFGEIDREDAAAHAAELSASGSWGPLAKVAGVAQAWRDLALELEKADVARVDELAPEAVTHFASRLWVIPPRGGFL